MESKSKKPCKKVLEKYTKCIKNNKQCSKELKILKVCKRVVKYGTTY